MKKAVRLALILAFALPAIAQSAPAPQLPSDPEIISILKDRVDVYKKSVGIVVGLIGPAGTRTVSYGAFTQGATNKPGGDSVFEIGSATKVFTSLLLADMVVRAEVKLDDPVSKFLPKTVKLPTRGGREITLVDLATHTSGLPRMPDNLKPKDPTNPYADYTVEQMYEFLSRYTLTRDIGAQYEYSNLGVGLLGHVLALRAGTDYESLVRRRITDPLKMADTRIALTPAMRAHLVPGHSETLQPAANWDIPTLAGAGALRSTANDLLKFLAANLGYATSPLAEAMKVMLATSRPTPVPNLTIALGWHVLARGDDKIIWHNGGTGGYHSFMGFDPKQRIGVVVLSNSTNDIDDIGRHILDSRYALAKLEVPKEHKQVKIDPKVFDEYVGRYELMPSFVISISREADALFLQATGQPRFQVFPESEKDFFLKEVDAQITFIRDDTGRVSALTLHQNGRDMPARKLAAQ